jgi:NAD(P)-dependent dehydrogenase (short-subunit alcohol dehydrogenase family)
VVIGCAQGHGSAIAKGCAEHGAEVLLVDRNPAIAEISDAIRKAGGKADWRYADVLKPETVQAALRELSATARIDGLIYFPRGRVRKDMASITPEDWDEDLDVALKGAFFSAQAALPCFGVAERHPFIITLSSILSGYVGNESAGYHSAKGGLESLTRYLAVHMGPRGIRVNAIQMGWIIKDGDLPKFMEAGNAAYRQSAERAHPLRKIGTSRDLLNTVVFLASENAAFITGQVIRVDGGLTIQEQSHLLKKMESA